MRLANSSRRRSPSGRGMRRKPESNRNEPAGAGTSMISAAIVGLGRWGRSLVESVHGKSPRIRFVRAIDTDPAQAGRFAAGPGHPFFARLEAAPSDATGYALVR